MLNVGEMPKHIRDSLLITPMSDHMYLIWGGDEHGLLYHCRLPYDIRDTDVNTFMEETKALVNGIPDDEIH